MEQNLPVIAKKVWSLMRVMLLMLKKGISKTKFLADLNMMMKRGKIAGKALHNLLFHHHHNWAASTFHRHHHHHHHHLSFPAPSSSDSEFSCTTSPPPSLSSFSTHKKNHRPTTQNPPPPKVDDGIDEMITDTAVMKMLTSAAASPQALFGRSLFVKQLRITDSPFPVGDGGEDSQVDEAAEMFIMRFYNDLRRQN